jgi:hypothetical protein
MKPLTLPHVNLNGTSRESLVAQQCDVMHALVALQKALQEASPNGRDFQTAPMGTFNRAQEAWRERYQVIEDMRREIEAHALAIQDGGK